jgi:hypothetical protein
MGLLTPKSKGNGKDKGPIFLPLDADKDGGHRWVREDADWIRCLDCGVGVIWSKDMVEPRAAMLSAHEPCPKKKVPPPAPRPCSAGHASNTTCEYCTPPAKKK